MPRGLPNLKKHKGQFAFRADLDDPAVYGTLEKFLIWCKRESMTFEQGLLIVISEGVDRHYYGNTQTLIHSYSDGGELNKAAIEGSIREQFLAQKLDIRYRDIVYRCKQDVPDVKAVAAMAKRVAQYLQDEGIKVWR